MTLCAKLDTFVFLDMTPRIATFNGVHVYVYSREHLPPHIHVGKKDFFASLTQLLGVVARPCCISGAVCGRTPGQARFAELCERLLRKSGKDRARQLGSMA